MYVPPELSYSSSTVLLEATVSSPVHVLYPDTSTEGEEEEEEEEESDPNEALTLAALRKSRSPSPRKPKASRQLFSSSQERASSRVRSPGIGQNRGYVTSPRARGRSPCIGDNRQTGGYTTSPFSRERSPHGRKNIPRPSSLGALDHSLSAQERLHSLLSSYVSPGGGERRSRGQSPHRVKFKPPRHGVHRSRREAGMCVCHGVFSRIEGTYVHTV